MCKYKFLEPLLEGVILARPNRFLMEVDIKGRIVMCHCPVTGKIGFLSFNKIPCLISHHTSNKRKHEYTIEAVSNDNGNHWIGINQTKINEFIEYFIKSGSLNKIIGKDCSILKREVLIGNSKYDFLSKNKIIEIKLFLNTLSDDDISKEKILSKQICRRLIRQFVDIKVAIKKGYTADFLFCFIYKRKKMVSPILPYYPKELINIINDLPSKQIRYWQINLEISKNELKLISLRKI